MFRQPDPWRKNPRNLSGHDGDKKFTVIKLRGMIRAGHIAGMERREILIILW
jgi:hypothetical protein